MRVRLGFFTPSLLHAFPLHTDCHLEVGLLVPLEGGLCGRAGHRDNKGAQGAKGGSLGVCPSRMLCCGRAQI